MTKVFNKNFHYTIETIMISFRPTSFTYLVNKRCGYQPRYRVQFILKHLKTVYINFIIKKKKYTLKYYLQQTHTSEKKYIIFEIISTLLMKSIVHYHIKYLI